MLSFLPAPIVGVLAMILLFINLFIFPVGVIVFALLKYLPGKLGKYCEMIQNDVMPSAWIDMNSAIVQLCAGVKWEIRGEGELHQDHWYFVFANHQTWADIMIMQKVLNRKIPILKFFMKQELLWTLPMAGLACWTLGFPFMKRYSKAYLKQHPEMRQKDVETTKQACVVFAERPTAVMNFLEGTRFTEEKRQARSSPYRHLLRPKSGGLAFVVHEMQAVMREVVDVTIVYNRPAPTFWRFITGQIPKVIVNYKVIPLSEDLYGDYYQDATFRRHFQRWVNERWQEKDSLIEDTLAKEAQA